VAPAPVRLTSAVGAVGGVTAAGADADGASLMTGLALGATDGADDAAGVGEEPLLQAAAASAATRASAPIRFGDVIVTGYFLLVPSGAARRASGG
jgi:hypothetical protein